MIDLHVATLGTQMENYGLVSLEKEITQLQNVFRAMEKELDFLENPTFTGYEKRLQGIGTKVVKHKTFDIKGIDGPHIFVLQEERDLAVSCLKQMREESEFDKGYTTYLEDKVYVLLHKLHECRWELDKKSQEIETIKNNALEERESLKKNILKMRSSLTALQVAHEKVVLEKESLEDEFQKIKTDLDSRSAEESRYQEMHLVAPHGIGQTRDGLHHELSNVIDSHVVASIMNNINETIKETEGLKEMLEVATKELKAAVQMIAQLNTKITRLENDLQQAKQHQAEFSNIIRENKKSISRPKHIATLTDSVNGARQDSVSCSGVPEHHITREKMQNAKSLDTLRDQVSSYHIKMDTRSQKLHNDDDTYKKEAIGLSNTPPCKKDPEGTTYFNYDPGAMDVVLNDDRTQNERFFHQYQQLICDTKVSSKSQTMCISEDAQTTCTILVSAVNQEGDSYPESPQPILERAKVQNQNHIRQCQQNLAIQQQVLTDQISRQIALLKGEIGQSDQESASECLSAKGDQDAKELDSTEEHNIAKIQSKCTDNNAIERTFLLPQQSELDSSIVDPNHNRSNVINGKFYNTERVDSLEQTEANVGKSEIDINTIEHDGASSNGLPECSLNNEVSLDNEVNQTIPNRQRLWGRGTDGSNKRDERNFPTSGSNVGEDEGNFIASSPDVAPIVGHLDENQNDVLEGEIERRQPVSENIDMSDKPKANRKRNAKFPRFNQASAKIRKNDVSEIFLELKCRASLLEHGLKNVINSDSETKRQNISHDVDKLLGDVAFLEGLLKNEGCNEVKLQLQKLNKIMMDACEEFHMLSSEGSEACGKACAEPCCRNDKKISEEIKNCKKDDVKQGSVEQTLNRQGGAIDKPEISTRPLIDKTVGKLA